MAKMKRTNFMLDEETLEILEKESKRLDRSKSWILRALVKRHLGSNQEVKYQIPERD